MLLKNYHSIVKNQSRCITSRCDYDVTCQLKIIRCNRSSSFPFSKRKAKSFFSGKQIKSCKSMYELGMQVNLNLQLFDGNEEKKRNMILQMKMFTI